MRIALPEGKLERWRAWQKAARECGFDLRVLARHCGVSTRRLHSFFLRDTGVSPKHWLRWHRALDALQLLRVGHSVKETAYRLHYKQPSHFTRDFRQMMKITPSAFVELVKRHRLVSLRASEIDK